VFGVWSLGFRVQGLGFRGGGACQTMNDAPGPDKGVLHGGLGCSAVAGF